jgi:hypothetical protein
LAPRLCGAGRALRFEPRYKDFRPESTSSHYPERRRRALGRKLQVGPRIARHLLERAAQAFADTIRDPLDECQLAGAERLVPSTRVKQPIPRTAPPLQNTAWISPKSSFTVAGVGVGTLAGAPLAARLVDDRRLRDLGLTRLSIKHAVRFGRGPDSEAPPPRRRPRSGGRGLKA